MDDINLEPLVTSIVIEREEAKDKHGDIIIPDAAKKVPAKAKVIKVGDEVMCVRPGDGIIVSAYVGTDVKVDGRDFVIISEEEVLAKYDIERDKAEQKEMEHVAP